MNEFKVEEIKIEWSPTPQEENDDDPLPLLDVKKEEVSSIHGDFDIPDIKMEYDESIMENSLHRSQTNSHSFGEEFRSNNKVFRDIEIRSDNQVIKNEVKKPENSCSTQAENRGEKKCVSSVSPKKKCRKINKKEELVNREDQINILKENSIENAQMKERKKIEFYEALSRAKSTNATVHMNLAKYKSLVEQVKEARQGNNTLVNKCWLLRHYDVLILGGNECLIYPIKNSQILFYVPKEHVFDVLYETHLSTGHVGRDKMRLELKKKYKNITYQEIQIFLNLCEQCLQKRNLEKNDLVEKPVIVLDFNRKYQVDVIDFTLRADGEYKFIMMYQDHLTKFVILKPLKSNTVEESVAHVLDIFYLFGPSTVLHSNNGREFCDHVIEKLNIEWPGLTFVHGQLLDSQLQDGVDRTKKEIEEMVLAWMLDQQCVNWSKGLGQIQFMKNRMFHSEIKRSPYEAMFRRVPKV